MDNCVTNEEQHKRSLASFYFKCQQLKKTPSNPVNKDDAGQNAKKNGKRVSTQYDSYIHKRLIEQSRVDRCNKKLKIAVEKKSPCLPLNTFINDGNLDDDCLGQVHPEYNKFAVCSESKSDQNVMHAKSDEQAYDSYIYKRLIEQSSVDRCNKQQKITVGKKSPCLQLNTFMNDGNLDDDRLGKDLIVHPEYNNFAVSSESKSDQNVMHAKSDDQAYVLVESENKDIVKIFVRENSACLQESVDNGNTDDHYDGDMNILPECNYHEDLVTSSECTSDQDCDLIEEFKVVVDNDE